MKAADYGIAIARKKGQNNNAELIALHVIHSEIKMYILLIIIVVNFFVIKKFLCKIPSRLSSLSDTTTIELFFELFSGGIKTNYATTSVVT
jgi:hypothetical protein